MAKQDADCITLDLFATVPREQQIRINKRNQRKRDKSSGLKRVELKLHTDLVERLEIEAAEEGLTRGQLIERILNHYINGDIE